jgi:hypothetical protein
MKSTMPFFRLALRSEGFYPSSAVPTLPTVKNAPTGPGEAKNSPLTRFSQW